MRHIVVPVLFGALTAGAALAGEITPNLVELLDENPTTTHPVIVVFEDAPGLRRALEEVRGDRGAVIQRMKQNMNLAQARFLEELGPRLAGEPERNWLANALFMDADRETVHLVAARPDVRRVELDEVIQLDPVEIEDVEEDDNAEGEPAWGLTATRTLEARALYGVDGSGVTVGILDTGYDAVHPDLAGKLLAWKDLYGDQAEPYDDHGHGTHCAGTIAGGDAGGRAIGMAPGAKMVAGKIFSGSGRTTVQIILAGMQWVVDPDGEPNSGDEPRLVSNSWGGGPGRTVFLEATRAWLTLGVLPVFAAGNSGPSAGTVGTPGGFLESLAVGATTRATTMARFSSRGPVTWDGQQHIKPDVSAPGKNVYSAKAGGGYRLMSGTSMATPHVAGLAALLLEARPDLGMAELRQALESGVIDEGEEGKDNHWGFGRVDTMLALALVRPGGTLHGAVRGVDGAAIPHARLTLDQAQLVLELSEQGTYSLDVPAGSYSVSADAFGYLGGTAGPAEVTVGGAAEMDVALEQAPSGTLTGVLTGAGVAVEGSVQVLDTPLAAVATGADGSFSLSLPEGTYRVMGSAYGFEHGTSQEVQIVAGQTSELGLDLLRLPPILVVDDDKGQDYEAYFHAALGDAAHKVVAHENLVGVLDGSYLAQYEVVVWFTGRDTREPLSEADEAALAAYLDVGGRLFLTGQKIAYKGKKRPFVSERLRVRSIRYSARRKHVDGSGFDFMLEGGDGADNQRIPDEVEVLEGAEEVLSYPHEDGEASSPAAVRVTAGDSRVVYFTFGLEGIDTAANRRAVMSWVLEYLAPSTRDLAVRIEALANRRPADADEVRGLRGAARTLELLVSERLSGSGAEPLEGFSDPGIRRMRNFRNLGF